MCVVIFILITMEIIEKIIKSTIEPPTNVLWDNGTNLLIYRNGIWERTVTETEGLTNEEIDLIFSIVFSNNNYYSVASINDENTNSNGIGDYDE